jgi:hypothetical protein
MIYRHTKDIRYEGSGPAHSILGFALSLSRLLFRFKVAARSACVSSMFMLLCVSSAIGYADTDTALQQASSAASSAGVDLKPASAASAATVDNKNAAETFVDCCSAKIVSRSGALNLTIGLCVAFWLATIVVRWNRIAHPTREMLRAQLTALGKELEALKVSNDQAAPIAGLLDTARERLDGPSDKPARIQAFDILFWSRGQELTGWGYAHEAEIRMVPLLTPDTVMARLESEEQALRASGDASALVLADIIRQERAMIPPRSVSRQKALLAEALSSNYEREDNTFADLLSWQNKTTWLVALGLLLIVVLTGVDPDRGIFFLVGALGGLLSRLSRSLNRKDVPTDYGSSWTTLFLSPVAGALGAWSALTMAFLAVKLNILNDFFAHLWEHPLSQAALGVALVFGFSERLLDEVLSKLEDKTAQAPTTAKTSAPQSKLAASPSSAKTLPDAILGQAYLGRLTVGGGATANWILKADVLPPGLTLNADGTFSGQPTADCNGKTYLFTATGTSQAGPQDLRFSMFVKAS